MKQDRTVAIVGMWRRECSKTLCKLCIVGIGIMAMMLLSAGSLQAQCPAGFLGPFTTTMTVTLPAPCGLTTVQVQYCIGGPTIAPPNQYHVTSVTIVSSSGTPCNIGGAALRIIGKALIEQNPAGFNCSGNCPTVIPNMKVGWGLCGRTVNNVWEPCPTSYASQGCADVYEVCCRCDGTLKAFFKTALTSDACNDPTGCETMCPGAGIFEPTQCP